MLSGGVTGTIRKENLNQLIEQEVLALYRAKEMERNQVGAMNQVTF
jgi:PleD family two-component response regulator